jgi:hypothetical protein
MVAKNWHDALHILKVVGGHLQRDNITNYCRQVCGGGQCGTGPICPTGIDPSTRMPSVIINELKPA